MLESSVYLTLSLCGSFSLISGHVGVICVSHPVCVLLLLPDGSVCLLHVAH